MRVVQQTLVEGVNLHLAAQWLDQAQDRWVVLAEQQASIHSQSLIPFSLSKPDGANKVDITGWTPASRGVEIWFKGDEEKGTMIGMLVAAPSGVWTVAYTPEVHDGVMSRLRFEGQQIELLPVWAIDSESSTIRGAGQRLFIATDIAATGRSLFKEHGVKPRVLVIRCGPKPEFVAITPLPDFQGEVFLDTLPY